jgi:hypothetical protein
MAKGEQFDNRFEITRLSPARWMICCEANSIDVLEVEVV